MGDNKTHFTGDDCTGGHYFAKACPTCGGEDREAANGCADLWHVGPEDEPQTLGDA